jgi:Fe-S oxidoreductase
MTMEAKYDFAKKYRDDILRCSRCGYCQAVCPAFGSTMRPALNARGKMLLLKEVMDGELELNEEMVETLCQCTTCAACQENCPSGVDVPAILKAARQDLVHIGSCHPAFSGMNDILLKNTNIYMEDELPDFEKERDRQGAENIFYVGCVGNYREDENTEATIELLDRLDIDFTMVTEVCCSGVLGDVGYKINPELAQQNIEKMLSLGSKRIICGCPYCYKTFTHAEEYKELADKMEIIHISQFLATMDFSHLSTDDTVTYDDSCELGRHCHVYD